MYGGVIVVNKFTNPELKVVTFTSLEAIAGENDEDTKTNSDVLGGD